MLARLHVIHRQVRKQRFQPRNFRLRQGYLTQTSSHEPLRILFCGTDVFSIESLKALHDELLFGEDIASIDVVTKTDKPSGRGLKQLKAPPLKSVAQDFNLPLHQIDTFTGWNLPSYPNSRINLVIAVSFGLLVPPRILGACKYGGLNVHPSLLPDLRGAAPIQWAIMHGYETTGVSIQTLHPSKFDEGVVLDQETIAIPNPDRTTFSELRDVLAPIGANLLIKSIQKRLHVPEMRKPVTKNTASMDDKVHFARRIMPEDQLVDFKQMNSTTILRRMRALPKLSTGVLDSTAEDGFRRIVLGADMRLCHPHEIPQELREACRKIPLGVPYAIRTGRHSKLNTERPPLLVNVRSESTERHDILAIPTITIGGAARGSAVRAAQGGKLFQEDVVDSDGMIATFMTPLVKSLWKK